MITVPKADHIFRPIGSIQDEQSHLFAGRSNVVDSVLGSLEQSGSIPVIFGERGIGKSSVAWRIFNILRYKDINPEFRAITERFDLDNNYIPLWIECGDWFSGIDSALLALLTNKGLRQAVTIRDLFPDFLSDDLRARAEATFELNIAIFKAGLKLDATEDRDALSRALRAATDKALADPIEMFSQIGSRLLDTYPESTLVVFIDEFDRLPDKSMVGSVLKTLTQVRFVIVGVGETSRELVGSHPSVDRKISNVKVSTFSFEESQQIFDNATAASLSVEGSKGITFEEGYRVKVIEQTGGYPNLIQKVGFHTVQANRLHRKMLEESVRVNQTDYNSALKAMFKSPDKRGAAEDEVEQNLLVAVKGSSRRQQIIRTMVDVGDQWVTLADLFSKLPRSAHQQLTANLQHLVSSGVILERNDDEYRFSGPMYLMAASLMIESFTQDSDDGSAAEP